MVWGRWQWMGSHGYVSVACCIGQLSFCAEPWTTSDCSTGANGGDGVFLLIFFHNNRSCDCWKYAWHVLETLCTMLQRILCSWLLAWEWISHIQKP